MMGDAGGPLIGSAGLLDLLRRLPVMLLQAEEGGRFRPLNPAFEHLTGWTEADAASGDLLALCFPEPEQRRRVLAHIDGSEAGSLDCRLTTRRGTILPSRWSSVALPDGTRVGIGIDLSEQRRSEERLRQSFELLTTIIEQSRDAIYLKDPRGRYLLANAAAARMLGRSPGDLHGRQDDDLLPGDRARRLAAVERRILRSGRGLTREEVFEVEGRGRTYSVARIPYHDERGRIVGLIGIARDITHLKQAEEDLVDLNRTLERRAEQLRAMSTSLIEAEDRERRRIAELVHDELQQLLVGARFNLQSLRGRTGLTGETEQVLERIDSLLAETLGTSRTLVAEISPPVLYEVGICAALELLVRRKREKYGLEVTLDCPEEPSELPEPVRVLLFKAVRELLLNVVKHSGAARARVGVALREDELELTVADEGRGFDPTGVRAGGGSEGGFGLFSLSERLELMRGRLEIESAPGRGARVRIVVPLEAGAAAGVAARRGQAEGAQPGPRPEGDGGDRIRVLLVDDHAVMRQGLGLLLEDEDDLEVVGEAANGQQAVALTGRLRPDVVVMDVGMPVMGGIEATERIRADWPEVRVVGLSMHDEGDMAARMLAAGASAYLNKAGPAEALLAAIRRSGSPHTTDLGK